MNSIPIQLSDASGVPFYRQIVDQVGELIRSGQLTPKSQLPSVRDLASQLLVSLITVRRAYADLENAGLIVRRQGHGTFVAEEIEMADQQQLVEEGRSVLAEAVGRALRIGLDQNQVRACIDEILESEGERYEHE